ncbi:cytochrome ubiquinol oxidase subunit I [Dietzia sp.]|uniref:cytochrome ubiquinol oxidase subunit I n=1 Tax=Dietzia sp. TaxID=1871616 RepID=UPI002FD9B66B
MDIVDISRWQFGITTVYHFIFVPLTIGLAPLVALMQTFWVATGDSRWYRATRFFGTVFLVNFAMGVVTGIVQEFQFGMNWSEFARTVGDVFGGPLALEGLAAFFLESTFLGLWIFGWNRLPRWLHTACMWIVAIAVNLSAYFIIAANSFMQHPVGAEWNPETNRAELVDIVALLTNNTALAAFPHAVAGSFLTAGTFVLAISLWWIIRESRAEKADGSGIRAEAAEVEESAEATPSETKDAPKSPHRLALTVGIWTVVIASFGLFFTGDTQAKLMFEQQPMKMASAESLCHTQTDPDFSVLTIGTHNNCDSVVHVLEVPFVLPFLAQGKFTGVELQGVQDLQEQSKAMYGEGNYAPNLFVTYWSFRAMIGLMAFSFALAVAGWWFTRRGRAPHGTTARLLSLFALVALPAPFLANSAGWIFTEMGRQPWVVHPNPDAMGDPRTEQVRLLVDAGVSDHAPWTVVVTLVGFTALYGALFCVWFWLIRKTVLAGPPLEDGPSDDAGGYGSVGSTDDEAPVSFTSATASAAAESEEDGR